MGASYFWEAGPFHKYYVADVPLFSPKFISSIQLGNGCDRGELLGAPPFTAYVSCGLLKRPELCYWTLFSAINAKHIVLPTTWHCSCSSRCKNYCHFFVLPSAGNIVLTVATVDSCLFELVQQLLLKHRQLWLNKSLVMDWRKCSPFMFGYCFRPLKMLVDHLLYIKRRQKAGIWVHSMCTFQIYIVHCAVDAQIDVGCW